MELVALGVGDAFSAEHYSSCVALGEGGEWLLIDCPHPIRKILRDASTKSGRALDVDSFAGVVVTHLHADHCSGLEGLGYFSRFVLGRRPRLFAHSDVLAELWSGHLSAGMRQLIDAETRQPRAMTLEDYFEVTPLDPNRAVSCGRFAIECRPTWHHIPTTALRVRTSTGSLGYSADTAFDPALIDWLSEADLVVHETNYGIHTPYEKLAALPAERRARMRLIHYPDDLDLSSAAIKPLREGEVLRIGG